MNNIIEIRVGELGVSQNNVIIRSIGIGSCVVVSVYDKTTKIGGMVHAMLPARRQDEKSLLSTIKNKAINIKKSGNLLVSNLFNKDCTIYCNDIDALKYVDEAVDCLLQAVKIAGANQYNLKAKVVGGAQMFGGADQKESIGTRNAANALEALKKAGVEVQGADVGGTVGRMADLNLANGVLTISTKI